MLAENDFILFYIHLPSYSHIATAIMKTTHILPMMIPRRKMIYKVMC